LASPNDSLFAPPLKDGFLSIPKKSGFGVELDEDKVRRFTSDI